MAGAGAAGPDGAAGRLAAGIGAYLDKREQQTAFTQHGIPEDVELDDQGLPVAERPELWLDYVADTGDGFNATYAVAYSLGRDIASRSASGSCRAARCWSWAVTRSTRRRARRSYDDRLRGPYHAALPDVPPGRKPDHLRTAGQPRLVRRADRVLPGLRRHEDHDRGLDDAAEAQLLRAAGCRSGWWLFALDAQQGAHIDDPQLEYFHNGSSTTAAAGDRIILCTPDPAWVQGRRGRRRVPGHRLLPPEGDRSGGSGGLVGRDLSHRARSRPSR